jgi:hypothetical protein
MPKDLINKIGRREFMGSAVGAWSLLNQPAALRAGSSSVPEGSAGNATTDVYNKRREVYLTSDAVKVKPAFLPLPAGAVTPQGWLRDWAVAAANGITGHLDEYSRTIREAWKGHWFHAIGIQPNGEGWPLEQGSYWLDGAVRLGYILNDTALISKVTKRLDTVVSGVLEGGESFIYWRPKSVMYESAGSDPRDAQFNNWGHSHMGRALVAYYQASGDPRVLKALVKVYSDYTLPEFSGSFTNGVRGCVNADAMLETYLMSGDHRILDSALAATQRADYRQVRSQWAEGKFEPGHDVIYYEHIRVPALLYPWTGEKDDLAATAKAIEWGERNYLLPMGLASGEEFHAGIGATRNVETCNVAASMWTFLWMLRITGDGDYSDRMEKVFFNAGPAPIDRKFKTMCYFQSPNRYGASLPSEAPEAPGPGSYWFSDSGYRWVPCCVANLNRVIPNYVMHLWMGTLDGGLAATLYGPSAVRATVAENVPVHVEARTAYPFEESITLVVNPQRAVEFPLYLRIPAWCRTPEIEVNGKRVGADGAKAGFIKVVRPWKANDEVVLHFPMTAKVEQGRESPYPRIPYFSTPNSRRIAKETGINSPYASIHYGPLLFSLPIPDEDPNHEKPGARYQFALDVSPEKAETEIAVVRHPMPSQWTWSLDAPLQLSVQTREFDWQPTEVLPLPKESVKGGRRAKVLLVPYGCTKFRVSMFPVSEAAWGSRG